MDLGGAGWIWVELGGAGWSWMELGARFSNTHYISLYIASNVILRCKVVIERVLIIEVY